MSGGRGSTSLSCSDPGPEVSKRAVTQAAYRARQKAKMQALEDQVQGLQEKLKALEIERAHNTAQLDALSQCVRGMELAPRPEAGPESGQEGAEQLDDEGAAAVAGLMASARGIGAPATSPLDYKQVTPAVMAGVWEETIQRCSALLQMGANDEASPAHAQLERHMQLLVKMFFHVWEHNPNVVLGMWSEFIARQSSSGAPAPAHIISDMGLDALRLSADQEAVIIAEFQAMMVQLNAVFAQQKALLSSLSGSVPECSGQVNAHVMLEVQEVSDQVQDIVREYSCRFCKDLVRPLQLARVTVALYPSVGDVVSISAHLVSKRGMASGHVAGMADVFAWLKKDSMSTDTKPQLF